MGFGIVDTLRGKQIGRTVDGVPVRVAPDNSRVAYDLSGHPFSVVTEKDNDWRNWKVVGIAQTIIQVLTLGGFKIEQIGAITHIDDLPPRG